jgi:hypothetical protein
LAERRKRRELHMFYNIQNNIAPRYLCYLISPNNSKYNVYLLRNRSDTTFCRLSITYDSFILSTIRQWNRLNPSLRSVEYIAKCKTELRKREDVSQVSKH